jgi:nitrogen fixation-related uncharacterized protein
MIVALLAIIAFAVAIATFIWWLSHDGRRYDLSLRSRFAA